MRISALLVSLGTIVALLITPIPNSVISTCEAVDLIASADYTVRERIIILGDDDFTEENGVVSGTGSSDDPYIIEGWEIVFNNSSTCITVIETDKHFVIRGVHMVGALAGVRLDTLDHARITGCVIEDCSVGVSANYADLSSVDDCVISNCSIGISLRYCDEFDLDGNTLTDNGEDLRIVSLPWITTRQANLVFAAVAITMGAFIGLLIYFRIKSGRPPEERP